MSKKGAIFIVSSILLWIGTIYLAFWVMPALGWTPYGVFILVITTILLLAAIATSILVVLMLLGLHILRNKQ